MKKNILFRLEIQVILSLIFATIAWIYTPQILPYIEWMWVMFMTALKVFLWPLLFFSITTAILSLWDFKKLWNIWARTFGYYMLTTTLAISTSLILMNILSPWKWSSLWDAIEFNSAQVQELSFTQFLQDLIPSNIFMAFVEFNAMQIVTTWIILGISLLALWNIKKVSNIKDIFWTLNDAILKFITFIIKLTPFGVFAIVMKVVVENGSNAMYDLIPFVVVILLALFIHACVVLPFIWFIIWWFDPFKYFWKVKEAVLVWFSTASSSATMWLSMSVASDKWKISKEVVDFSFPIGTTINMDWTALYQAWVAIFVAQVFQIDLSIAQQLTIVVVVILASIGAAWVPWAGILILTTVFLSIWLPVEAIWIILAVDRILDMFRTAINVWWDLLTAKVVDRFYKNSIAHTVMENIPNKDIKKALKEV
jgi:proton glutamate symport protein